MLNKKQIKMQRFKEKLSNIYYEYILSFIVISIIIFFEFSIFINFFI